MIARPILVFDPSGGRKDDWNERGLKKSGPYDQRTFSPKQLRIAVVCQARHEGRVDAFMAKFLDGMPNALTGRNKEARYGDGFLRRFSLDKPAVTFFTTASPSAVDYVAASHEALTKAADEGFKWDLAMVQVEEEFKGSEGGHNPYYATKSVFLKRDVPVQERPSRDHGATEYRTCIFTQPYELSDLCQIGWYAVACWPHSKLSP